jgi:tetratricopeptide (TPR) repeat protein
VKAEEPAAQPEFAVVDESATAAEPGAPATQEIDLSSEWDDAVTVESDATPEEPSAAEPAVAATKHAPAESIKVDETIEEIRFYLGHGMPEQALAALAKLQTLTSDKTKLDEVRAEVEAATRAAEEAHAAETEPEFEELTAQDVPSAELVEESPAAEEPSTVESEPAPEPSPVVAQAPIAPQLKPPVQQPAIHALAARQPEPEPQPEPAPGVLKEFVSDLESSLGDGFLPGTVSKPAVIEPARAAQEPAVAAAPAEPVLGEFVADIEASLGEDFLKAAPVAEQQPAAPAAKAKPVPPPPAPPAPPKVAPLAASAAASASPVMSQASPVASTPAVPAPAASVAWAAPVGAVPNPQPPAPAIAPPALAKSSPFGEDAGVDLAEMFGELKQDLEADVASADEDPETHYNLGIAFREMGLLDEAIGELQKACQSFDRGHPFPQIMQTYTWLAQCFLEKGVPEAAVRWYDKALQVPSIDGETRVALNYELASAYETAGDKSAALRHFMDVYGSNIDYRDVAERIKALKS